VLGGCVVVIALALAAPYWIKTDKADFIILKENHNVNDFAFETIDGQNHTLSDFQGRYVLLHFWATWCPPCIKELPDLIDLAEKQPDIAIIAVSTDHTREKMKNFLESFDLPANFHAVFDAGKVITEDMFATYQLPETVIINPDQTFRRKIIGAYAGWTNYTFE
jgi:thiol-disulfide isomerase/thioredoxin